MKGLTVVLGALALAGFGIQSASADSTTLQEISFNVNGTFSDFGGSAIGPLTGLASGFDANGLGELTLIFNPGAAGNYFVDAFLDYELHAPFYNEYGVSAAANGTAPTGVRWQIDEPGLGVDLNRNGDIFTSIQNDVAGTAFDNTNHIPGKDSNFNGQCGANAGGGNVVDPNCNNDVSFGWGVDFALGNNEQATIKLDASHTQPNGGFYLQQVDPDTPSQLFLTGSITIGPAGQPPPPSVPEPSAFLLTGTALLFVSALGRKLSRR